MHYVLALIIIYSIYTVRAAAILPINLIAAISRKRGFPKQSWPIVANTVASSQVEGFVRSTGCLSTYAVRVVLSHQLHRGLGGRL